MTTTVVVPTFDHGPMLRHSVGSALDQTDADLEVLIIGDGVPDAARAVARELEQVDARVRFIDHPKGAGHGESYREAAVRELARGDVVCYLSDDDLWASDHVATMRELLRDADFAHALPVEVTPNGGLHGLRCDLGSEWFRSLLLSGQNRIPLSCGAHTARAYARLRHGWRVTPSGTGGDLACWQQFVGEPGLRLASGFQPTVLHFPSPDRDAWTMDERLLELQHWRELLRKPAWRSDLDSALLPTVLHDLVDLEASLEIDVASSSERARLYQTQLLETWGTVWWQMHVRIARHRFSARVARALGRVARATKRARRA